MCCLFNTSLSLHEASFANHWSTCALIIPSTASHGSLSFVSLPLNDELRIHPRLPEEVCLAYLVDKLLRGLDHGLGG